MARRSSVVPDLILLGAGTIGVYLLYQALSQKKSEQTPVITDSRCPLGPKVRRGFFQSCPANYWQPSLFENICYCVYGQQLQQQTGTDTPVRRIDNQPVLVRDPVTGQVREWQGTTCPKAWWNLWGVIPCV